MNAGRLITVFTITAFLAGCGSSTYSPRPSRTSIKSAEKATETPSTDTTSMASADAATGPDTRIMYVNVDVANVRAVPDKSGTVVAKLKFLEPVGATGVLEGEWVQVAITSSDGTTQMAWVHGSLISASREQAEAVKAAAGD